MAKAKNFGGVVLAISGAIGLILIASAFIAVGLSGESAPTIPCEVIALDDMTQWELRDDARAELPVNANGVTISTETVSPAPVTSTCTP